jgi:hypothetical protein
MQSIVLELWIIPFHLSSIIMSFSQHTGAPTKTVGGVGRTGSGFFFFLGFSSSAASSSSSSIISLPSSSNFFTFSIITTGSGSFGGG